MAALSKPLSSKITHTCYEIGHTWTPSCKKASIDVAFEVCKQALKIYGSLYVVSCNVGTTICQFCKLWPQLNFLICQEIDNPREFVDILFVWQWLYVKNRKPCFRCTVVIRPCSHIPNELASPICPKNKTVSTQFLLQTHTNH